MKVLFDHSNPFLLAHGGFQIQIEQTKKALEQVGIEVDWLRWSDSTQTGDIIHYFGRPSGAYIDFAHQKGIKVVMSELLTGLGSRTSFQRGLQKTLMIGAQQLLPSSFTAKLAWEAYHKADAIIALTPWEKKLMIKIFDASPRRVHVVPNGVEEMFFLDTKETPAPRSEWLICTATITPRKRVLELAEAAILAQTPVWIIGKPYSESDPYYLRFLDVVRSSSGLIRYEGGISDRARLADIYQSARGFVLLSTMESLSLSALEAVASGCPLLLSNYPWAVTTFGSDASYCYITSPGKTAVKLKEFYNESPKLPISPPPYNWKAVAEHLVTLYRDI